MPQLGDSLWDGKAERRLQWQTKGAIEVYHYTEKRQCLLSYNFAIDLKRYPDQQLDRSVNTLILHGRADQVVPIQASQTFAAAHPTVQLIELESDHSLGNVLNDLWMAIAAFLRL